MRSISVDALAKLAQRHGTEPITIIEVDWSDAATRSYADRTVGDVPGRIIDVGALDNVIAVSDNDSSQSLDVTLDDTDGSIKAIFDGTDIHKRNARVYQYFDGLDLSDKFLLFAGKVSSPITWNERDRTISFTILSQLEDREVGFSAEEGQFPYLPADLVGKPWPMIFGTVRDCPALQVNHAITGTLLEGIGILSGLGLHGNMPLYASGGNSDANLGASLAQISAQLRTLWCAEAAWSGIDEQRAADILSQINALHQQMGNITGQAQLRERCAREQRAAQIADAKSRGLGANPARILGGEDFPQGVTLTLEINGGLFTGFFRDDYFFIQSRQHPEDDTTASEAAEQRQNACNAVGGSQGGQYDYRVDVPCGRGNTYNSPNNCECRTHGTIVSTGLAASARDDDPVVQHFWAEPGSTVRIHSGEAITYIVSIVPGTVLAVKAYKQFEGYRRLVDVPSDLYTVSTQTYGTITAVQLVFNGPLSSIKEQGWSDDVYVTFQSSVGPDTVAILEYLIGGWTDLTVDAATFEDVRAKLVNFPMNFPLLERKNTLDVLQDIAYQARCALWVSNGVVYLKYLPEEPTPVDTITVSHIDAEYGVEVALTPTEDLITKMRVGWRLSWAPGETDQERDSSEKWMILRHNITRYGTQEEEFDWYCYNQPDIILKNATFWLIRKSNTWKILKFKAYLNKLHLETFDCVTLDFPGYVATGAVKAIVLKANYNSADNEIDFECLVPVRAGEMAQSKYYWPAALRLDETWPPQADIDSNNAGGGGVGMGAQGSLPVGYIDGIESGGVVWVGGPNVAFKSQSDWGDRRPTDRGFSPQRIINTTVFGELRNGRKPKLNLRVYTLESGERAVIPDLKGGLSIDIATTRFVDSRKKGGKAARLTSVFNGINEQGKLTLLDTALVANSAHPDGVQLLTALKISEDGSRLCLKASVWIADGDAPSEKEFYFKYDSESDKYAAGLAYLKD